MRSDPLQPSAPMGAQKKQASIVSELIASGVSVGVATALTNPLDVVKVRQQMRGLTLRTGERAPGVDIWGDPSEGGSSCFDKGHGG